MVERSYLCFFPPNLNTQNLRLLIFKKKKSIFEVLFAYHKTHPTRQSYHI